MNPHIRMLNMERIRLNSSCYEIMYSYRFNTVKYTI